MSRKSLVASLAVLLLVPALVYAGLNIAQITTGPASGSFITYRGFKNLSSVVSKQSLSGYAAGAKTFNLRAHTFYGYTSAPIVTNNGIKQVVTAVFNNRSTWTYTAPAKGTTQNINVAFKAPAASSTPVLNAVLPTTAVMVPVGGTATLSGQTSTLKYLPVTLATATWSGDGLTFTPASATVSGPGQVTTQVSAAIAGNYTATLTLTATGATTSSTSVAIVAVGAGVVASNYCLSCHTGWAQAVAYAGSVHSRNAASSCQGCHNPGNTQNHPFKATADTVSPTVFTVTSSVVNGMAKGTVFCTQCHNNTSGSYIPHPTNLNAGVTCVGCHTDPLGQGHATGDAHSIQPLPKCIECHAVQQAQVAPGLVNDNNGVRAITTEFAKWSHHVDNSVTLSDAHCAACHLEGTTDPVNAPGEIIVDRTKHMVDGKTHLRNSSDDSDMQWDPATPNHTTMDNFCMSCHSATGAKSTGSKAIQALINTVGSEYYTGKTASPTNPFGDTISNRYDKMQRPAVVNVDNQFDTTNNSHHGVKGARYTGRTRTAGSRQIASPGTFNTNSSASLFGARSTMYDAGNLNALYSPLGTDGTNATGLGDDSTLHCGDCHTVGQWKVGSSDTANGSPTPVAIGAHGSNNEYLLRNTLGTDERHTQNAYTLSATNVVTYTNPGGAFLVCYNCHTYTRYGSIYVGTALNIGNGQQGHIGEYDVQGRCNGIGNTLPFYGFTSGKATDGTQFKSRFMLPASSTYNASQPQPYLGEQDPDFGNVFGVQCLNCHTSGARNAYGGIHGSFNNTDTTPSKLVTGTPATGGYYVDGMGNTTKSQRFLPGLGDAMHTPGTLGGFTGGSTVPVNTATGPAYTYITGGVSNDANWEQKIWNQTAASVIVPPATITNTVSAGAGCYTLGGATAATSALRGPSVTGNGGPDTTLLNTWGGCVDHGAVQGATDHGFVKRIVRPVTY